MIFIPEGRTSPLLKGMASEAAEEESRVVVITDHDLGSDPPSNVAVIRVNPGGEAHFCLAVSTTQCLLLDALARRRRVTAGIFRHGAKVTTRE